MAYSPIAFTAANYRDYKNWWLKAYEPSTTTPKSIATDSTLATLIAKAELNKDGFIVSAGGALIIPYIDDAYDLWLFPTEAEADANDTSNALRLADNITGVNGDIIANRVPFSAKDLAEAVNETNTSIAEEGNLIYLEERTTGNGGGALWKYVDATSVTPNTFNIVQCVGVPSLALQLIIVEPLKLKPWGAIGDGIADDTAAIQNIINYTRDRQLVLEWEDGTYRTTSSLVTQYDSSFKQTYWRFSGALLEPDFSGSPCLIVEGKAQFQRIEGQLRIIPSVAQRMTPSTYANRDDLSHGVEVRSTRLKMYDRAFISSMRGRGINIISDTGGNSNTSKYDAYIELCDRGFVISGTDDNISVSQLQLDVTACAGPGIEGEASSPVRQWDAWIKSEGNCVIDTGKAAVQFDNATTGRWFIYSEQQNAANEIAFNGTSTNNTIQSARNNKDSFVDNNYVIGSGIQKKGVTASFTPIVSGSTTAGTATYSTQTGTYQQVGNIIHFSLSVAWSGHTGSGNLRVTGLPNFPVGQNAVSFGGFDIGGIASGSSPMGYVDANKFVTVLKNTAGSTGFVIIQAAGSMQISGTYFVQ